LLVSITNVCYENSETLSVASNLFNKLIF
jgi:hypothetical protein